MKISRDNYEIWFADWLDGKLTNRQQEELKAFLNENPDLKKEFDDLSELSLAPSAHLFPGKISLKRNLSEIPSDQFELLCAASLEGDLSPDQLSELADISAGDPEKKKTADLFALTKLNPPAIEYQFKKKLYRRTRGAVVIRLALPSLSAAAVVLILLMSGIFKRQFNIPENIPNLARAPLVNTPAINIPPVAAVPNNPARISKISSGKRINTPPAVNPESVSYSKPVDITPVEIKPVFKVESLKTGLAMGPAYIAPGPAETDEERSRLGKFLARNFREKVLEEKTPSDKPLKGYEIAEAGITGINKLLGWEMALTRKTDDKGQTSSVNFNSRLLKFNAPVKNNEQGE